MSLRRVVSQAYPADTCAYGSVERHPLQVPQSKTRDAERAELVQPPQHHILPELAKKVNFYHNKIIGLGFNTGGTHG